MAQLRQDYDQFDRRHVAVVVIGPESRSRFAAYFNEHALPFIGLPDPKHEVLRLYGQQIDLFKLGRLPAQVVVDREGIVRFVHYGNDMTDIPSNREMLSLLDRIAAAAGS